MRSDSKISSLVDALASAKKEIESSSARMRDLEALLNEERRAREDAEERANRLERESSKDQELPRSTIADGEEISRDATRTSHTDETVKSEDLSAPPNIADIATSRLQQRLESMMDEMSEMKQQMEKYRLRAEEAEAETETHRKTLAEMVEKLREDDARRATKAARRRSRSDSELAREPTKSALDGSGEDDENEEGEITIINEKDMEGDGAGALLRRVGVQNGHAVGSEGVADLTKVTHALATRQSKRHDLALSYGGPAVSIFTVVALGVAVMAWLNTAPKVER